MLRLACADILPFEFNDAAATFGRYVKEVVKLADDMRDESVEKNRRIDDGTYTAYSDPTKTFVVPAPDDPVPYINFAPLQNALTAVETSARAYEKAASGPPLPLASERELDRVLMGCERAL